MEATTQKSLRDKFANDLKEGTCVALVKWVCGEFPYCKGDYRLLVEKVQKEHRKILHESNPKLTLFELKRLTFAPDTIGRRYRELAAACPEYYPRPVTRVKRGLREEAFKVFYGEQAFKQDSEGFE